MHLHNRIKKIREHFHLSQLAMSESLGISRAHVSRIETGAAEPSEQLLKLICATWAIDENWLRTGQGKMRSGDLTKKELESVDELVNESFYDEYIYKSRSACDYLRYIESEFIEINSKPKLDFKIDKNNPSFRILESEFERIRWAYINLVKTFLDIVNEHELLIGDEKFIQDFITEFREKCSDCDLEE